MKLNKREKRLLYILLCVLLVVGGIFLVVLPAFEKNTSLKAKYKQAEQEMAALSNTDSNATAAAKDTKSIHNKIKKLNDSFYSSMQKEDLDAMLTQLVMDHGLTPVSLTIEDAKEEEVLSFTEQKQKNKDSKNPAEVYRMQVYNAEMQVSGDVLKLQQLVDTANASKSMKVSAISYTEQNQEQKTMRVAFKVFMVD